MTVHVLLTADNHLDPSAVQYGPRRFERKRDFQHSFEVLVNFALENRPDLFLIGGDFYDGILPGNPTRAYVAEQFKRLHEKEIKVVLVSGHHDTPRSIEQGVSPLSVHAKTGHVYFLQDPRPTPKMFHFGSEMVNVTGMSLSPGLSPEQDPLAGQELSRDGDVKIFLTHYPIEGFEGYFGQETHIGKSSIPKNFQLFASGHLHRHQKNTINGTPVMYPGSTERVSFNEEGEEKGRGAEKILRIRVTGRVSLDQLSTYKRSALQSYCQERFFHTEFDEDGLNVLTTEALESMPRTTPLEELDRAFQALLANVKEEERPIVHEAWKATVARLQEEGVS